jgi:hypothetical protein
VPDRSGASPTTIRLELPCISGASSTAPSAVISTAEIDELAAMVSDGELVWLAVAFPNLLNTGSSCREPMGRGGGRRLLCCATLLPGISASARALPGSRSGLRLTAQRGSVSAGPNTCRGGVT